LFIVPLVVAGAVLGYALVFPELSEEKPKKKPSSVSTVEKEEPVLDAVLRVLNDDERKVIETLVAEGGTMLQKDIRWETGLSRVKIHRILFRLAQRGIVSAEKYYNTNKIELADWLRKERKKPTKKKML
jgi:predicted transcriptional regulator